MAEQQTRPPDMSPTEMPQPSVVPRGRYPTLLDSPSATRYSFNQAVYTTPYEESHDLPRRPGIEQLLDGVWHSKNANDPAANMLEDRLSIGSFALGDVLRQIRDRLTIYHRHLEELEQAKMQFRTVRKQWLDPQDRFGHLPDPEGVTVLQGIDAQQRAERLSAWKDISTLRQRLPEHWQGYLSACRQYNLLNDATYQPDSLTGGDPHA
jgi:hypothetical protein